MPTYQYACTECGHAFEQFQSFTDDALSECPRCQGRLRKLFNAVGVVFKGSGFYRTDSRAPASADASAGASGSGDAGSTSGPKESSPAKESTSSKESGGAKTSTSTAGASASG